MDITADPCHQPLHWPWDCLGQASCYMKKAVSHISHHLLNIFFLAPQNVLSDAVFQTFHQQPAKSILISPVLRKLLPEIHLWLHILTLVLKKIVLLAKAWPENSEYKRQTNPVVCNLGKLQKERNLVPICTSAPPLAAGKQPTGPGFVCKEIHSK